jgi:hypothetical protein
MRSFIFSFLAASTVVTVVACGPDGTTPTGADGACGKYYDALTAFGSRCATSPVGGTRTDFIATCKATVAAPGSGVNDTWISGCADAVSATTSCALNALPACKAQPGKLADGSACGSDIQCASGDCKTTSSGNGPSCGTCAKVAKEGEACNVAPDNLGCGPDLKCANQVCVKSVSIPAGGACSFTGGAGYNCVSGTVCNAPLTPNATGICAPLPKKGEACTLVCDTGLTCTAGKCADKLDVGATCTSSDNCKSGLYCDGTKKCAAQTIAKVGQPCGSSQVRCDTGLSCEQTGTDQSTCVALKKNGEACTSTDRCAQFLVCVNGKCAPDDPGLCK